MRIVLFLAALAVALPTLTGCGQSGDLYLPDDGNSTEDTRKKERDGSL